MKDTETILLAFYKEILNKKEKIGALPEDDSRRANLLAEYKADKVEYNRRRSKLQQRKEQHKEQYKQGMRCNMLEEITHAVFYKLI